MSYYLTHDEQRNVLQRVTELAAELAAALALLDEHYLYFLEQGLEGKV
jgi:hypothetical protein